jgi:aryl-alcohol dehydrogenase-like predicted oxidoreductase
LDFVWLSNFSLTVFLPSPLLAFVVVFRADSLCVRKDFEAGLGEACYHHNVGLLAYSPLAAGTLTGKYRGGNPPKGSRLLQFPGFMDRYLGSQNERAVNSYCDLAAQVGLTPAQLALGWCYHHSEHVASTIIGATSLEQLDENLKSYDVRLEDETLEGIADIYRRYTDPTKARGPVRLSSQKKA